MFEIDYMSSEDTHIVVAEIHITIGGLHRMRLSRDSIINLSEQKSRLDVADAVPLIRFPDRMPCSMYRAATEIDSGGLNY